MESAGDVVCRHPLRHDIVSLVIFVQVASSDWEDELKLEFAYDALHDVDPFATQTAVHVDVAAALKWQAARSPQQVMHEREMIMQRLEAEAGRLWYLHLRMQMLPSMFPIALR